MKHVPGAGSIRNATIIAPKLATIPILFALKYVFPDANAQATLQSGIKEHVSLDLHVQLLKVNGKNFRFKKTKAHLHIDIYLHNNFKRGFHDLKIVITWSGVWKCS